MACLQENFCVRSLVLVTTESTDLDNSLLDQMKESGHQKKNLDQSEGVERPNNRCQAVDQFRHDRVRLLCMIASTILSFSKPPYPPL